MAPQIGGTLTYYTTIGFDDKPVKLNDFNAKFSFNRGEDKYNNSIMVLNNKSTVEKGGTSIRVTRSEETPVLENIFNYDRDMKTFSKKDYETLQSNVGKTIKLENGYAYKVSATDEEKAQGIIHIEIREILADKTTRSIGKTITIDIETETEKALREDAENKEALSKEEERQTQISNFLSKNDFEFSHTEECEDKTDNNSIKEFVYIKVNKEKSLGEIREELNLGKGVLIKYNPTLTQYTTFWDKVYNWLTDIQNLDIIDVENVTIKIPTSELNEGKYNK